MSAKKPKYPLRAAELIGKKFPERGAIIDSDNELIRKCATYEEAESVAEVMNHVHALWEPRFAALEQRERTKNRKHSS